MGNGADKILDECERMNIEINEVIASDDFVRGQCFRGFAVKKLAEIEEKYDNFVVVPAFASQIDTVMQNIYSISEKHTMLIPGVPVFGQNIFNKDFYFKHKQEIELAYSYLEDEQSKKVYKNYIKFMLCGTPELLKRSESSKQEALCNVLKLSSKEYYADLGAYKGDTIDELLKFANGYSRIYAFEPDAGSYKKLCAYTDNLPGIYTYNLGIWNKSTTLKFEKRGGRNSCLSNNSGSTVEVTALDDVLSDKPITYIKMDIEGAEYQGIMGAKKIISEQKPKLNIGVYHRSEDIFTLPALIKNINRDYKIYLRHHPYIPFWDTNIYCV